MKVRSYSKDFFIELIDGLNAHAIKYCIIGDYMNLPESVSHDIDLWTDNVCAFREVLFSAISKSGHRVLIDNKTANGCNVAFYKREGQVVTMMKIDVMTDTSYKSVLTLVDKQVMAKNLMPYKNFYVATPESEAVMHFLYPLFEWGKIKKNEYKEAIFEYHKAPVFKKVFIKLWGAGTTDELLSLIEKERWAEIVDMMGRLKKKALLRGLFKSTTWMNIFKAAYYTFRRKIRPSGKVLAFCGLDGAGKTTILDELNDMFVNLLKSKKVFYGYWRPYVIPEIRELFGRKNSKDGVDKQAQKGVTIKEPEKKSKNKVVSMVKLIYYWIDFMLAGLKYGTIHQRGGMVLFDRHYVDMAVHPERFEMGLSRSIILFMYRFIPKADYTFFLYCTPEEILKRKEEFTKEEIAQMTNDYLEVGKNIKNFVPVHTNTSIAEEIDEILSHIVLK